MYSNCVPHEAVRPPHRTLQLRAVQGTELCPGSQGLTSASTLANNKLMGTSPCPSCTPRLLVPSCRPSPPGTVDQSSEATLCSQPLPWKSNATAAVTSHYRCTGHDRSSEACWVGRQPLASYRLSFRHARLVPYRRSRCTGSYYLPSCQGLLV